MVLFREIFIKITKNNTNLSNIKHKDPNKLEKHIRMICFVSMLYNYILMLYKKYLLIDIQNNKKINISNYIKGFYEEILLNVILGNIQRKKIMLLFNIFVVLYTDSNKKNNERYSIMPYTKFHIKYIFKNIKN